LRVLIANKLLMRVFAHPFVVHPIALPMEQGTPDERRTAYIQS